MKKIMIALVAVFLMAGCADFNMDEGAVHTELKDILGINDGLSAYEIAVENGFTGTEVDWLDSLRGDAGIDGIPGLDGLSAYQLWILAGNEGMEEDFILLLQGVDGIDGVCPNCDIPIPDPQPDPAIPEGTVRITLNTDGNFSNYRIVHFLDSVIISIEDVTSIDGVIEADIPITSDGDHGVGFSFTR